MEGDQNIVIKKYNAEKQTDFRISPTPKLDESLVEKSILKFEKLNENTYIISLIDSANSDYDDLLNRIIDKGYKKSYLIEGNTIQKITEPITKITTEPLNQIFYGPPGTGKTYTTITTALDIIGVEYDKEDYADAEEKFRSELGNRIEFVTMHQSYSYEDFIQGLKPNKTEDGTGIVFDYKDGIFKEICKRADLQNKMYKNYEVESERIDFDVVFDFAFKALIENKEPVTIDNGGAPFKIYEINNKTMWFETSKGTKHQRYTIAKRTLKEIYQLNENNIIISGNKGYFDALLIFLNAKSNELKQHFKSNLKLSDNKNFVIILDEINRANISRVFGELIALIEVNKRDGRLTATLPSGELFSVPSNLYVIGTMNTADKSIALVDIALRRRFKFKALYPNLDTLGTVLKSTVFHNVKMDDPEIVRRKEILKRLNKLIRTKKSVDFEIGHSYFMEDDTLGNILNNQILPLLNEYFMYDLKAVKNLIENQHKDSLGNNIQKTGIVFNKPLYDESGLLEVEKIDFKLVGVEKNSKTEEESINEEGLTVTSEV
jgi:5-methylcytosine-specific restriction endonuclease McrBC GTP-binding regulatory subunit McrB